ncbi:HlyD family efflux transporter periplasmic adaptor subunit [Proteinivorax tanatarense]|uniref:HlyD family efflux transporter periplasmic adaptor subunit n=1 Tax=Proteinivorax tanatarense TaxID=1260629 RepID=A0AAU7VR13_9FIRM
MKKKEWNNKRFSVVSGGKDRIKPASFSLLKVTILVIAAAFFLFLLSHSFLWIRDFAVSRMIITEYIEVTSMQQGVYGDGLFIWDEEVVYSPRNGSFQTDFEQFQRARKDQTIGSIGDLEITSPKAGLIVFHKDGFEYLEAGLDNPEIIKAFEQQDYYTKETTASSGSGKPLFKVVDNFNSQLIVKMGKEKFESMQELSKVRVNLRSGSVNQMVVADIVDYTISGENALVHVKPHNVNENFFNERFAKVFFILDTVEGIKLPSHALIDHKGQEGVYVINRNKVEFRDVVIVDKDAEYVWVYGLDKNSEVIFNPKLVKDGQKIR